MISTYQLMRPMSTAHEQLYLTLMPLKQVLATQCVFLARAYQQLQQVGIARIQKQFSYTWEKRVAAYHQSFSIDGALEAGADGSAPR